MSLASRRTLVTGLVVAAGLALPATGGAQVAPGYPAQDDKLVVLGEQAVEQLTQLTGLVTGPTENADGIITVTATVERSLPNTSAMVRFGTLTRDKEAGRAVAINNELLFNVFEELARVGVPAERIRTSNINLSPVTDQSGQIIVGFEMTNMISVQVDDLSKLGETLEATVAAGINRIDQVSMTAPDSEGTIGELRIEAAKLAAARARAYADAMGLEITGIVSVNEGGGSYGPRMNYDSSEMAMSMSRAMPTSGGESDLSFSINASYSVRMKPASGK